jgi:hypothetical protein
MHARPGFGTLATVSLTARPRGMYPLFIRVPAASRRPHRRLRFVYVEGLGDGVRRLWAPFPGRSFGSLSRYPINDSGNEPDPLFLPA